MIELNFLCEKNILARLIKRTIFVFCYENKLVFPVYTSDQKFENSIDLLLVIDENKSHYVYIKVLTNLCLTKQNIKTKNSFARVACSVLVVKMF